LSVKDSFQLADFMRRIQQQTTLELRHLVDWWGPAWQTRYKHEVLSHEEANLLKRLRYVLSNGCKEGLVMTPCEWPGPSSTRALCEGRYRIPGEWVPRTDMHKDGDPAQLQEHDYASAEEVQLWKLPGFEDLSDQEYSELVRDLAAEIEAETRAGHKTANTRPMGRARIRRVSPHRIPKKVAWGPRPRVIAATRAEERRLLDAIDAAVRAHRDARDEMRRTKAVVEFPEGTFPSPRAFVLPRDGP